jgi:hypothetical protein
VPCKEKVRHEYAMSMYYDELSSISKDQAEKLKKTQTFRATVEDADSNQSMHLSIYQYVSKSIDQNRFNGKDRLAGRVILSDCRGQRGRAMPN